MPTTTAESNSRLLALSGLLIITCAATIFSIDRIIGANVFTYHTDADNYLQANWVAIGFLSALVGLCGLSHLTHFWFCWPRFVSTRKGILTTAQNLEPDLDSLALSMCTLAAIGIIAAVIAAALIILLACGFPDVGEVCGKVEPSALRLLRLLRLFRLGHLVGGSEDSFDEDDEPQRPGIYVAMVLAIFSVLVCVYCVLSCINRCCNICRMEPSASQIAQLAAAQKGRKARGIYEYVRPGEDVEKGNASVEFSGGKKGERTMH